MRGGRKKYGWKCGVLLHMNGRGDLQTTLHINDMLAGKIIYNFKNLNYEYYKIKKSASLRYFDTCFMHNMIGVFDRQS